MSRKIIQSFDRNDSPYTDISIALYRLRNLVMNVTSFTLLFCFKYRYKDSCLEVVNNQMALTLQKWPVTQESLPFIHQCIISDLSSNWCWVRSTKTWQSRSLWEPQIHQCTEPSEKKKGMKRRKWAEKVI
jgi:hypothetical protein